MAGSPLERIGFCEAGGRRVQSGVGFVRRRGIRHGYATFGAHPRPRIPLVQEVNPYGEIHHLTDLDSELLTRRGTIGFGVQFLDGSTVNLRYNNRFERLESPFQVDRDGEVVFPEGEYDFQEGSVSVTTSRAKPLSASGSLTGGSFFSGSRVSVAAQAQWRASYRLLFDVSTTHDDVSGEGGAFTADVLRTRIKFAYNTSLFGSANVQYNSQTDEVVTNVRVNLIYAPLSDVFLVFTERREGGFLSGLVIERQVTAKVTRLLAF